MRLSKLLCTAGVITLGAIGLQLVATQAASAHSPSASINCTGWTLSGQSYNSAETNTYGYSIDGAAEVVGTFTTQVSKSASFAAGSGNHTLLGYIHTSNPNPAYSHTYNLSSSNCASYVPVPAAPAPSGPTCSEAGAATIPANTDTVHWALSGNVATATAQGSNTFPDGTKTKSFTETVAPKLNPDSEDCATHVSAAAPAFADGDCTDAPSLAGAIGGTGYTVSTTGTVGFGNTVTVTFTAAANYRLDGTSVYTFHYAAAPDCRTATSPVDPGVTQATCDHASGTDSGFAITPAGTDGISYTVSGLLITATASDAHKLGTLPNGWQSISDTQASYLATRTDPPCLIDAGLTAPSIVRALCTGPGSSSIATVTPAVTDGISYVVSADLGTVTATPNAGHEFGALPVGWTRQDGTAVFHTELTGVTKCAAVSAVHEVRLPATRPAVVAAASVPLASTGVPTMSLVLLAGLLVLSGGALCLGVGRRSKRS